MRISRVASLVSGRSNAGVKGDALVCLECKCRVNSLEQRLTAHGFAQEVDCSAFQRALPQSIVRMGRNEDHWNGTSFAVQMILKLEAAHARQIDVQDQARSLVQALGSQEFLRRTEGLHVELNRSHQAHERFPNGRVVINDRYTAGRRAGCCRFLRALVQHLHLVSS
jgi:hypothetical protein